MTFKEWLQWFKEIPWTVKWFVILILLRPIIDNFYKLKDVSPFISPLNIAGVLTPVLIIASIFSGKVPRRNSSSIANMFFIFGFLVIVNWLLLDILFPSIDNLGNSIKSMTPPVLLFYMMYIIRSERDLHGILVSFLYSGIYLVGMMIYEFAFGSISGIRVTEGRGGGERFIGFYNDMMNYAIYIVSAMLIGCYFFLRNVHSVKKSKNYTLKFVTIIAICIMGLIGIKHISTWVVCLVLFTLLAIFNLRKFKGFFILLFLTSIFMIFFGESIYTSQIEPLIGKELNVASGDAEMESGLNGRVGRWERYFDVWFTEMPWYSRFVGVPTSGNRISLLMCGAGMHNDYVRNLFTAGIVGLFFYLLFLLLIIYKAMSFRIPERFLIIGSIVAIMLHSISTVPLAYSSYIYLLLSVISFALLPVKKAYHVVPWKTKKTPSSHVGTRQVNRTLAPGHLHPGL
jgi:O-antigen ligase